jgi:DNA polymerase elongation subunit (family B)
MVRPIKPIDSVVHIVRRVRVHNVNYYEQTQAMRFVHQILKVIGGSLARSSGEVAGYVVPK